MLHEHRTLITAGAGPLAVILRAPPDPSESLLPFQRPCIAIQWSSWDEFPRTGLQMLGLSRFQSPVVAMLEDITSQMQRRGLKMRGAVRNATIPN